MIKVDIINEVSKAADITKVKAEIAVETLLDCGADPLIENDHGSTAADLAQWTTGRGGTGTPEAKAEQAAIIELLDRTPGRKAP